MQSSCDFPRILMWGQKKGLRPQSFMKSGESPQKLRKNRISTDLGVLGLDLYSSSPEAVNFVNFFGAQSSLGEARPRNAPPPRGAGPALMDTRSRFQRTGSSSFEFLLTKGDLVERSDRNVLQGTFLFSAFNCFSVLLLHSVYRGGVLKDTFWSPSPWSLKSSKIALSSARGQQYFSNP